MYYYHCDKMISGNISRKDDGTIYLKVDAGGYSSNTCLDCDIIKIQRVSNAWEVRIKYKSDDSYKIYSCFCDSLEMNEDLWEQWVVA